METFFMLKRQQFKDLREKQNPLKIIAKVMSISERTCKRWNKELLSNNLIRGHGLTNKKSNFKSKINKTKIFNNYLALANKITKDKKAEPSNFSYAVEFKMENKCSLSTFKNIMRENYLAAPWAQKSTKNLSTNS